MIDSVGVDDDYVIGGDDNDGVGGGDDVAGVGSKKNMLLTPFLL